MPSAPLPGRTGKVLRIGRTVPTDWFLCDIPFEAIAAGPSHGAAHLCAGDGT